MESNLVGTRRKTFSADPQSRISEILTRLAMALLGSCRIAVAATPLQGFPGCCFGMQKTAYYTIFYNLYVYVDKLVGIQICTYMYTSTERDRYLCGKREGWGFMSG